METMSDNNSTNPSDLLERLFRRTDGKIELRALPSGSRMFVSPDEMRRVRKFAYDHREENVFFGVAARKDASSGRAENCSEVRTLYADVDYKDYPSPEDAMAKVDAFPLRPTFVVNTGGGLHLYWLLDEPVILPNEDFKSLLRRLAIAIGADLSAAEPARILRLPGTLNHKYSPPREVYLVR